MPLSSAEQRAYELGKHLGKITADAKKKGRKVDDIQDDYHKLISEVLRKKDVPTSQQFAYLVGHGEGVAEAIGDDQPNVRDAFLEEAKLLLQYLEEIKAEEKRKIDEIGFKGYNNEDMAGTDDHSRRPDDAGGDSGGTPETEPAESKVEQIRDEISEDLGAIMERREKKGRRKKSPDEIVPSIIEKEGHVFVVGRYGDLIEVYFDEDEAETVSKDALKSPKSRLPKELHSLQKLDKERYFRTREYVLFDLIRFARAIKQEQAENIWLVPNDYEGYEVVSIVREEIIRRKGDKIYAGNYLWEAAVGLGVVKEPEKRKKQKLSRTEESDTLRLLKHIAGLDTVEVDRIHGFDGKILRKKTGSSVEDSGEEKPKEEAPAGTAPETPEATAPTDDGSAAPAGDGSAAPPADGSTTTTDDTTSTSPVGDGGSATSSDASPAAPGGPTVPPSASGTAGSKPAGYWSVPPQKINAGDYIEELKRRHPEGAGYGGLMRNLLNMRGYKAGMFGGKPEEPKKVEPTKPELPKEGGKKEDSKK